MPAPTGGDAVAGGDGLEMGGVSVGDGGGGAGGDAGV
jgi:hypothetical protein